MGSIKQFEVAERKRKEKLAKEHKLIDNIDHKLCNQHHIYFPKEDPWIPATLDNFYRNDKNKSDYLHPDCKRCSIARTSKRRLEKLPEIKEYLTDYYKKHREDIIASNQKYQEDKKDYYRELGKKFRGKEESKVKMQKYWQTRKHKSHKMSDKEWLGCKQYFDFKCAYCGMTEEEHKKICGKGLHKEHVIFDGRNDIKNCVTACHKCNRNKNEKTLNEFYNKDNKIYTYEKYHKIYLWLRYDFQKYIQPRKMSDRAKLKKLNIKPN